MKGIFTSSKKRKTTFIVFAQGRTGSTILVDLINRSNEVHCDGEIFGASMPIRLLFPKFYKRTLANLPKQPVYGYRIKIYDLVMFHNHSPEESIQFLRSEFKAGHKVIYLHRTDKFRQAMSSLVAEARGDFHYKADSKGAKKKIHIDAKSIPMRIDKLNEFTQWDKRALDGFEFLDINYETDLLPQEKHQETLDRICSFLNIDPCVATSEYKRSSVNQLEDYIENYDEVKSVLEENQLHTYLNQLA
ncbi:MAG: hypothetical protein KC456_08015 [Flavobacteriales bacterium]|nr:hypothetical protein [Flavobacteriales bacterium]